MAEKRARARHEPLPVLVGGESGAEPVDVGLARALEGIVRREQQPVGRRDFQRVAEQRWSSIPELVP